MCQDTNLKELNMTNVPFIHLRQNRAKFTRENPPS